jgi:site-specific recombinase XerD
MNMHEGILTVRSHSAKTGDTRHVPLNGEALETLQRWRKQNSHHESLFPVTTTFKTAWSTLPGEAEIATRFRWHDLCHHFASPLVQAGVPLNTVRELLGHGSMAMTIRYAHLAPDQKREAVDKLARILTTTQAIKQ